MKLINKPFTIDKDGYEKLFSDSNSAVIKHILGFSQSFDKKYINLYLKYL